MAGAKKPTVQDLAAMSFLSWAAYDRDFFSDPPQTADTRVAGSGWTVLSPIDLGMLDIYNVGHFFQNGNAAALVTVRDGTIAIAIRGSGGAEDLYQAGFDEDAHFQLLEPLFQAVLAYINLQPAGSVEKIYITGHSLGGIMAELFAVEYGLQAILTGADIEVATFGSPGTESTAGQNALTDVITHVGHQEDGIFNRTYLPVSAALDENVRRNSDDEIKIVVPDESGTWPSGEHSATLYQRSLYLLAQSPLVSSYLPASADRTVIVDSNLNSPSPNGTDPNPNIYASDYAIASGGTLIVAANGSDMVEGHAGSDWIDGGTENDILYGRGGNDILYGSAGNDELTGGSGSDLIDGGAGSDTFVFEQSREKYDISVQGSTVVITPLPSALQLGTDTVTNVESSDLFRFAGQTYTLAELQPPSDASPPVLAASTPVDTETGVVRTTSIVLTFNESVYAGTGYIEIHKSDGTLHQRIAVTDQSRLLFSGNVIVIDPSADFLPGTGYYVTIDTGAIVDRSGNAFAGILTTTGLNFTTSAAADTSAPVISNAEPSDNDIGIPVGANVVLTFNENVVVGSGNIVIRTAEGTLFHSMSVTDSSQITVSGNTLMINPNADLATGTDYFVTVDAGAVRDLAGNAFAGIASSTSLNFTTQSASELPPPRQETIFVTVLDNSIRENAGGGVTVLSFGVTLTGAGAGQQPVSIQYATEDIAGAGSPALAGQDYIATSGVLVIPAGQTVGTINITLLGDSTQEPDEVFRLVVSQPSADAVLVNTFATGSIINDDQAPNRAPVGKRDIVITDLNTPIVIDVLANDTDPDGDALSINQLFNTSGGATYSITPDNKVLVTPNAGFTGILTFNYVIQDARGFLVNSGQPDIVIVSGDGTPGITNNGAAGDDIISGGNGNDTLSGGFGDDIIAGGLGSDRIDGGAGFDYLDLRQANHAAFYQVRDDFVGDDGDGGNDVLVNVEGILGTRFDDFIDGSSANIEYITTGYRFYGNDGNDTLKTDAGNDILDGGAGDDHLMYGTGADTVFGGAGNDWIEPFTGDAIGDVLDGGPGNDLIYSSLGNSPDAVSGGAGNDFMQFSNGDVVSGGPGSDWFQLGGFGSPYRAQISDLAPGEEITWFPNSFVEPITPGDGSSTAQKHVEYSSGAGITTLYFGYDATPGADFVLTIAGEFALNQFQVEQNDPNTSRLRIQGGSGDDVIEGGSTRNNLRDGGAGNDTIDYSSTIQGVTVDLTLSSNQAVGPEIGTDQILNVENVIGGSGNDTLTGNNGDNVLTGNAGNDVFVASAGGNDALLGGDGDDTFSFAGAFAAADSVNGGAGSDALNLAGNYGAGVTFTATTVTGVETINLTGSNSYRLTLADANVAAGQTLTIAAAALGAADVLTFDGGAETDGQFVIHAGAAADSLSGGAGNDALNGNGGNDFIQGRGGADAIAGGGGDDWLDGGVGTDTIDGGAGTADVAAYGASTAAVSLDLQSGVYSGGDAAGDVLSGIEGLSGSALNDSLFGNVSTNRLFGQGGNDFIQGRGGADTLSGGTGDDWLDGGTGADTIDGGAGTADVAAYGASTAAVSLDLQSFVYSSGDAAGDVLSGIEGLSGSAFGDSLFGNASANRLFGQGGNDFIQGRGGVDTISGGDGDDWLDGGTGADTIDGGNGSSDVAAYGASTVAVSLDLQSGVYSGGDAAGDVLTAIEGLSGSAFNDSLFGNASANRLFGQGGNDFIQGRGGVDTIVGGDGDDWLDGGAGADAIDGGAGTVDIAAYGASTAAVSLDLQSGVYSGGDAVGDVLTAIEGLSGSGLNDTLFGNASANRLFGQGGHDTLAGRGGDDQLTGGNGDDIFVFANSGGVDRVNDFDDFGNDLIQLSVSGISNFNSVAAVMTQVGADVLIDFATTDILLVNTTLASVQADDFMFV